MAKYYTNASSFLPVPESRLGEARKIIEQAVAAVEEAEDGSCDVQVEVQERGEGSGVWFHGEESVNLEHLAEIARALVEGLEIDEPFVCSWSYDCSKPRIDAFGGGALVIKRGYETYWCDATGHVQGVIAAGKLVKAE